jgi:hypothetical protein
MMNIKPIRTPADDAAVPKELERLWDKAQPGTPEGETFEVLSTLVDAYERDHIEIPTPDRNRGDPLPHGAGGPDREGSVRSVVRGPRVC